LPSNSISLYWKEDPYTRIGGDKLLHTRSYIVDNLKFWVGSQSHKYGCLCSANSNRRVRGFETMCGHV